MYNPFLVRTLKKCETGEAVDAAFEKRKITDLKKRISYLNYCQGSPQVFFGGKLLNADNTEELNSQYLTVRSMFVTGSWR